MKINILEIKKIVDLVIERYIENNGEIVSTDFDYFWNILSEDALNFQREPQELAVDSFVDDYTALREILTGREINILDLERIANIFRLISIETDKSADKFI